MRSSFASFAPAVAAAVALGPLASLAFAQIEVVAPDEVQSAAIAATADWFEVTPDHLSVFAAMARDWSTPALGCPEDGHTYAQVITPGYLIGVQTDDNAVALVHTDSTGTRAVVCEEPTEN